MLKFREITGKLDGQNLERWQDIKRTFKRNLLLGSASQDDQLGQVIAQMTTFSEGLYDISLDQGIQHFAADDDSDEESLQSVTIQEVGRAVAELEKFNQSLDDIKNLVASNMESKSELIEAEPINHKIEGDTGSVPGGCAISSVSCRHGWNLSWRWRKHCPRQKA